MGRPSAHLTARDRKVLENVHRHRLGTDDTLRRWLFPDVQGNRPVRKVAKRLIERRFLREYELAPGEFYYVLAPRGARAIGVRPSEPRPFTDQSLPSALAIAYQCASKGVKRFTAEEFVRKYPYLCRSGLRSSGYFLEETEKGLHVGFFIIDRGATPRVMLTKIRKVISKRYKLRDFAKLMQDGRFVLVILTGYAEKQHKLEQAIFRKHSGPVQVRVEIVPELGHLLTRLQTHEAARRDQS
jgi:hypothetical protein